MPIRFAYHPGNVAHSSAPEVDETMRAACRSLDIELIDMPGRDQLRCRNTRPSKPTPSDNSERENDVNR